MPIYRPVNNGIGSFRKATPGILCAAQDKKCKIYFFRGFSLDLVKFFEGPAHEYINLYLFLLVHIPTFHYLRTQQVTTKSAASTDHKQKLQITFR